MQRTDNYEEKNSIITYTGCSAVLLTGAILFNKMYFRNNN